MCDFDINSHGAAIKCTSNQKQWQLTLIEMLNAVVIEIVPMRLCWAFTSKLISFTLTTVDGLRTSLFTWLRRVSFHVETFDVKIFRNDKKFMAGSFSCFAF